MTATELLKKLETLGKKEVYFGPQGFLFTSSEEELEKAQTGFAIHPDGTNVVGENKGDWQKNWQVIALDTELGDPYFIDLNDDNSPVYTAIQFDGVWEENPVASSLADFISCLTLFIKANNQASPIFVPDENTVVDKIVLAQLQSQLIEISRCKDFWEQFFECYVDWLNVE
ncbi:MAG: hypothetical protein ACI9LM_002327 [Alteromonadaceae bacterium]|jgi:hypothetical protein